MRATLAAILLCASLVTSGCTIAGSAIGAGTPRYETTDWRQTAVPLGTQVRVRVRNIGTDAVVVGEISGRYGGIREGLLSVTDEDGREHELAVRDVVDLEVRSGTQWKKGLLLGAAADAIIVTVAVAIANGANVSLTTGP
jgi:hypothetical protein